MPTRPESDHSIITVFDYNAEKCESFSLSRTEDSFSFLDSDSISWINVEGLQKQEVEKICNHFNVHPLLIEDILSVGQRPKMDEIYGSVFVQLQMLFFNSSHSVIETEQVSILLGKNFVISFQEDSLRDVFDPVRDKLRISGSKIRQQNADFLFYSLVDQIVDRYYGVMEKLGDRIEELEELVIRSANKKTLAKIIMLRKEMIVFKRNVTPVRELLNTILRSESELLDARTEKYFKDVYDHIVQANDMSENYRDMMMNLQDIYMSNVNLKTNEVMKVMAIVTCLLAPATVIGGIFGMNFDLIPLLHNVWGFYISVGMMLLIPLLMLLIFRKRGWF